MNFLWYNRKMRKFWWVLLFTALFSTCAQTPENDSSGQALVQNSSSPRSTGRGYHFRVDASCKVVGFSIMVNGADLAVVD